MSSDAKAVMDFLAENYFADPYANYEAWTFTPDPDTPSTRELFELDLIERMGLGREGPCRLTDRGHDWIMNNRKLEGKVYDDDFDTLAYPDTFTIGGVQYKGRRNIPQREVKIPCDQPPRIGSGETFVQESPVGNHTLKVIDTAFLEDGTLGVGTHFRNLLTLHVENVAAEQHRTRQAGASITVGQVTGENVQIGTHNQQTFNFTIKQLAEKVAASGDPEAKNLLVRFLNNATVGGILGAGTAELLLKIFGGS
jgi:hypothetical protein